MRRLLASLTVLVTVALLAAFALADPPHSSYELKRSDPDAGASDAGSAAAAPGFAPDPIGLTTKHRWVVDLAYQSGTLSYRGARRVELARPAPTPRMMGRFALELYVGRELLDRVRFDFPLLGADDLAHAKRPWNAPPSFERKLSTSAAVMIPHSDRATRLVVVDRASGEEIPLPWPFDASPDAGSSATDRPDASTREPSAPPPDGSAPR